MTNEEKLKEIILSAYPNAFTEDIIESMCPHELTMKSSNCNCHKKISCWDCLYNFIKSEYIEPNKEYSMKEYQE